MGKNSIYNYCGNDKSKTSLTLVVAKILCNSAARTKATLKYSLRIAM